MQVWLSSVPGRWSSEWVGMHAIILAHDIAIAGCAMAARPKKMMKLEMMTVFFIMSDPLNCICVFFEKSINRLIQRVAVTIRSVEKERQAKIQDNGISFHAMQKSSYLIVTPRDLRQQKVCHS